MAKKSDLFGNLRERRGLSQKMLADLSGRVERTVSTAEADPHRVSDGTLRDMLTALAGVAPFSINEAAAIVRELAWDSQTVQEINQQARRHSRYTGTVDAEQRAARAMSQLADHMPELAALLDAVVRLCTEHTNKAEQQLLRNPELRYILADIAGRQFIELFRDYSRVDSDGDPEPLYIGTLPINVFDSFQTYWVEYQTPDGQSVPIPMERTSKPTTKQAASAKPVPDTITVHRVHLPPKKHADGSMEHRFEYYTNEGRRLVPVEDLPPRDEPKRDTGS